MLPKKMLILTDALDLCDTQAQCTVATACIALADSFPSGRGFIVSKHSTDVEFPPPPPPRRLPPPRLCMSVYTRGESCSDIGSSASSQ
jgi:hypothetical protein